MIDGVSLAGDISFKKGETTFSPLECCVAVYQFLSQRFLLWCRRRESNPHSAKRSWILSPVRLPIPPLRQWLIIKDLGGQALRQSWAGVHLIFQSFDSLPFVRWSKVRISRSELTIASEQSLEFLDGHSCVLNDPAHCVSIDRVSSRNDNNPFAVGHRNMLSLPHYPKPCFFKRPDGRTLRYTCKLRHGYAGTSTTRVTLSLASSSAVARYVLIASFMFSSASSSVAPCDQHPGNPGHQTA